MWNLNFSVIIIHPESQSHHFAGMEEYLGKTSNPAELLYSIYIGQSNAVKRKKKIALMGFSARDRPGTTEALIFFLFCNDAHQLVTFYLLIFLSK